MKRAALLWRSSGDGGGGGGDGDGDGGGGTLAVGGGGTDGGDGGDGDGDGSGRAAAAQHARGQYMCAHVRGQASNMRRAVRERRGMRLQ